MSVFSILLILLAGTPFEGAGQTTEGPNYAATGTNVTGVGTVAWSNPGRVTANDNSNVTITLNSSASNYLQATNFGFSIPANAIITGITVNIGRYKSNGGNIYDAQVRLLKNGSVGGDNKAITGTNWTTSETAQSYGGTTDLWGTTWIASDINASNFGVALAVNTTSTANRTAYVDYIQVSVTYTASGFWYKADAGVTGTTTVTFWTDQSGNENNASNSGTVSLVTNSINFNPSLTFTNVTRQFLTQASSAPLRFIIVNQPVGTNDLAGLIGAGPGSVTDKGIRQSNDASDSNTDQSWLGDNNGDDWAYSPGSSRINGASSFVHSFKWHIVNQNRNSSLANSQYYLGGYYSGRPFTGKIAEIVAYNSNTNPSDAIIESYLAIKYGISLAGSYYASDGTTIWASTTGYQNDIHGIGRDDVYGLDQRSSKSENPGTDILIIQSGSSFTTPLNAQTGTTLSASRQFFIAGHDNGSTTTISALSTSVNIITRKWYAQVSGSLSTESFQFNLTGANFGTYCKIGILIADDAAISSNLKFVEGTLSSSTLTVNDAAITGNKYFTVATLTTPTAGTIGSGQTICSGDSPATINSETDGTGFGIISYQWESSIDGTNWNIINGATSSIFSPGILTQTTYYRRKTIATLGTVTCTSDASGSVLITVNDLPTAPAGAINSGRCGAGTLSLSVSDPGTGYTIDWYSASSGGTALAAGSTSYTTPEISATTTYYAETRNTATDCVSSVRTAVTATVYPLPSAPVVETVTQPTCATAVGSVALSGLPATGIWTLTRNPGGIVTTGTGTSTVISDIPQGTYTFTVTGEDLNTFCPGSGTGLLAEYFNNVPASGIPTISGTPDLTRTDATVGFNWGNDSPGSPVGTDYFSVRWTGKVQPCYSETYTFTTYSDDGIRLWINGTLIIENWTDHAAAYNSGTINLTAGQKYDLVLEFYERGGQAVSQLYWSSPSQTNQIIPMTQLYSVATGCTSVATSGVVINAQPAAPAAPTVSVAQPTCSLATGTITVSSPLGSNYEYNIDGGTYQSSPVFAGITTGIHTVIARRNDDNTCISSPASVTINAQPSTPTQPVITPDGVTAFCSGESVTLTSSSGNSYLWSTGETTQSISVSSTGDYSVQVTNADGCQSIASEVTTVTVNDLPVISTHPQQLTVCENGSGSFTVTTSAYSPAYQWQYSTPDDPLNWVNIPNTNGFITGATTENLHILSADVTWSDYNVSCLVTSNGCTTKSNSVKFIVDALPTAANAGTDQSNCNNGSFTLLGNSVSAGTGTWSVVSGTGTITEPSSLTSGVTGVPAGTSTTLRWTISNGSCTPSTDDVVLLNNMLPTVFPITGGGIYCEGGSGVAIGLSGSETGVNYQLYRNGSTPVETVAGTGSAINFTPQTILGTYTVKAIGNGGCESNMTGSAVISIDTEAPVARCKDISVNLDVNGQASITPAMINNESTDNCEIASMTVSPSIMSCITNVGYSKDIVSSDGYTVHVKIPDYWVIPATTDCQYGYNYNLGFNYEITFSGTNIPSELYNLQVTFDCNNDLGADLPKGGGTGNGTTWGSYRSVSDCADVTTDDLGCINIKIKISGPGIADQTVILDSGNADNIVTLTATDVAGNSNTCQSTVTLNDVTLPSVTCPSNVIVSADANTCTAASVTLGTPVTGDNCGIKSVANNIPVNFPVGNTTVTWTVTDNAGNTNTCAQTVTVNSNPVDVAVADLGNTCQSGVTGSQTTIAWTINNLSGVGNWTYHYVINNGTSDVADATRTITANSDIVSYTTNNTTGVNQTFTIIISAVADSCGTTETNTENNSDTVTLYGEPATGEIIPD